MEAAITGAQGIETLSLRYGFFYGPGTWYSPKGTMGVQLMRRFLPIIGDGAGLASFIHIDDAVDATVRAMTAGDPGIYNVTDDEPATWRDWVTEAASLLGAKPPRRLPAWLVKLVGGPIPVHYATTLRAASNDKARRGFGLSTRPWREGFKQVFGSA
jgi:nucleoside-diphosphate-sugar epimerase